MATSESGYGPRRVTLVAKQEFRAIEERRSHGRKSDLAEGRALEQTRQANAALLLAALNAQQDADEAAGARKQFEALLSGLAEGVVVLDGEGCILLLSPAAREILDLPDRRAGEQWELPSPLNIDGSPAADEAGPVARALRGERFTDIEGLVVPAQGRARHCLFSGNAVRDRDGLVTMAIITVRDVTALRDLEELREDYLALISHDLRNPLAVVMAAAERLSKDEGGTIDAEILSLIASSAARMNTMLDDLMDAASLESGKTALEKEPVAISSLIATVVKRYAPTTERHIEYAPPAQAVPTISGDAVLIERVLANLLTNAFKYSAAGAPVIVSLHPGTEEMTVSVRDEGRGIDEAVRPFIFDRFYRVNDKPAQTTAGYGLGLYICRMIVEAHGGRIWVESSPGMGSTFSFTLPVSDSDVE